MEAKSSDIEERDLRGLLESLGSAFSLEDIANAYCEAKKDVDLAAEILCASNNDELKGATSIVLVPKTFHGASLGSVSGVVGRDYVQSKTWTRSNREVSKPLKLNAKELPQSEIWGEKSSLSVAASKGTVSDDVLGLCGYDVQKTMEELLDVSASTLEKYDDVRDLFGEDSRDQHPDVNCAPSEELCNSTDSPKRDKDKAGLQKEILESLFNFSQISEELSKQRRPVSVRPYRRPAVRLPENTTTIQQTINVAVKEENDDDENSYKALRGAVREHWITMKEYYRAAVDAFVQSDYARADRLLEQGHFFNRKAREADEKSAQKLFRTNESNDDEIPLDLHEHEPKQALRLLKFHLTTLSGIHAIKHPRVIVGTEDEDIKGARKKLVSHTLEISLTNLSHCVGE
ncbi:Silencing defective 5 isoform 1 [Spatholobus suberectus]|nr:Silencing defective 5 isoform 1 [Spatholobus suberectus]